MSLGYYRALMNKTAGFVPSDISNQKLWWDFSDANSYTEASGKVSIISDLFEVAPDFEQTDAGSRASIVTNNLVFTGNEGYSQTSGDLSYFNFLHNGSDFTIHLYLESDVAATGDTDVIFANNALSWSNTGVYLAIEANQGVQMQITRGVSSQDIFYFSGSANNTFDSAALSNASIIFDPSTVGATCVTAYKEGVSTGSTTLDRDDYNTGDALRLMTFGGSAGASAFNLKAKIRAILMYDKALTTQEISDLNNYYS